MKINIVKLLLEKIVSFNSNNNNDDDEKDDGIELHKLA